MKTFIEQQQELADKLYYNDQEVMTLAQVIEKVITNTGEELLRLVKKEKLPYLHESIANDKANQALDTMKQHIKSVTGVK